MRNSSAIFVLIGLLVFSGNLTGADEEPLRILQVATSDTLYPPSRTCHDIWVGRDYQTDVGEICIHTERIIKDKDSGKLDDSEREEEEESILVIAYATKNTWLIHESFLWIGTSLSDMPRLHSQESGLPSLEEFPYIDWEINGKREYEIRIPLQDLKHSPSCSSQQAISTREHYYIPVHPVLIQQKPKKNITGQDQSFTAAASSQINSTSRSRLRSSPIININQTAQVQSGLWWMEFSFDLHCQPSPEVESNITKTQRQHKQPPDRTSLLVPTLTNVRHERRLEKFQQRQQSNGACPMSASNVAEANTLLTEGLLYQFHIASVLALSVSFKLNIVQKIDHYRSIYERFNAFDDDFNDAAGVAKVEQTCYAVFRGTIEYNSKDVAQNFVPGYRRVPGTDCYVRRGYYDAYFTSYQQQFDTEVRECVSSCRAEDGTGADCQLILSGASQGAANAVVASIYLYEEFDPYVISFGVPRVFLPTSPFDNDKECTNINKDRQYHFLLTDSFLKVYDPVPYYPAYWTKYVGREILFDGEGNFNDQGLSTSDNDKYHLKRSPTSLVIHTRWNYFIKAKQAYDNACLPVAATGWFDGHWCSDDDNCQPTSYCPRNTKVCSPRLDVGTACDKDAACLSGSCGSNDLCLQEQKLLAKDGDTCLWSRECASGRCDGFWGFAHCQAQLESGQGCNEHTDCLSSHCVGVIKGKCL